MGTGAQRSRRPALQVEVEYDVVALHLTASEVAAIIKDATGVTVDPKATNFLQALDTTQLETIRQILSENARWRRPRGEFL